MKRPTEIYISKSCYRKILRWALLSKKEIVFYAFGKRGQNTITHICRLRNTAQLPYDPRYYFFVNGREADFIRKKLRKDGLSVIIEGHSHPSRGDPAHPSKTDVRWMRAGTRQIIVAPFAPKGKPIVSAWSIKSSFKETLKRGRIQLIEE